MIAEVEQFWDRQPCNIRHSKLPVGTREYFNEAEARKYFVEPHIPAFAAFPKWRGKHVLELGCGLGVDTINFARHGARVTAIDISSSSLALAQRRADVFGLSDRITFIKGDIEELDTFLQPTAYDLVYAFGVVHHTPHPNRAIDQMRHYVSPDTGIAKIMVYHRRSWKVATHLLRYGTIAGRSEAQAGCPVAHTYTRREAASLLRGFRITSMQVEHIFPYRVQDYVKYRYVKAFPFNVMPARLFRWLERQLGWHICITAEVEGDAGNFCRRIG